MPEIGDDLFDLPAWTLSVATLRRRIRNGLRDDLIPDPLNAGQFLTPAFSNAVIDEAILQALSVLSLYRPRTASLPDIAITAGQVSFDLPTDFMAPIEDSWRGVLPQNLWQSGKLYGARYAYLRLQDVLSSPRSVGYGGVGNTGGYGGGYLPFATPDFANRLMIDGLATGLSGRIVPADFGRPAARLLFGAPAMQPMTLSGLTYAAQHGIVRLQVAPDGLTWLTDTTGSLVSTPVYDEAEVNEETDIVTIPPGSDAVRLVLLYSRWWTLAMKILDQSGGDGDTFAFYSNRTGQSRIAIQRLADAALEQFENQTRLRAFGLKG